VTIGGAYNGPDGVGGEGLDGSLDELVIHGRALSDDEVADLASGIQPASR
jgi:hypothetical protein